MLLLRNLPGRRERPYHQKSAFEALDPGLTTCKWTSIGWGQIITPSAWCWGIYSGKTAILFSANQNRVYQFWLPYAHIKRYSIPKRVLNRPAPTCAHTLSHNRTNGLDSLSTPTYREAWVTACGDLPLGTGADFAPRALAYTLGNFSRWGFSPAANLLGDQAQQLEKANDLRQKKS